MDNTEPNIVARSFELAVRIVRLAQELDLTPVTPRTLANQALRSGTSIGANVEEAQAAQRKADFTAITKKSRQK